MNFHHLQPQTQNFHRLPTVLSRFLTQNSPFTQIITQNHHLYLQISQNQLNNQLPMTINHITFKSTNVWGHWFYCAKMLVLLIVIFMFFFLLEKKNCTTARQIKGVCHWLTWIFLFTYQGSNLTRIKMFMHFLDSSVDEFFHEFSSLHIRDKKWRLKYTFPHLIKTKKVILFCLFIIYH